MITTLYLDMDGVIADFASSYKRIQFDGDDKDKFKFAVLNKYIFANLEPMPNCFNLINGIESLRKTYNFSIQMLTSCNSEIHTDMHTAAMIQKNTWLLRNKIFYPPKFVQNFAEKAKFGNRNSVLIDDREDCIDFFGERGFAILHQDDYWLDTIDELKLILEEHNS